MPGINRCELPPDALLVRYRRTGTYTDCFVTEVDRAVAAEDYFRAFYTTWLFGLERRILAVAIDKPSTDAEAAALAAGRADIFSAWRVEDRSDNQLLLADFQGNTRSWLMIRRESLNSRDATLLYFGSAVLPQTDEATGRKRLSPGFRALLGFHKLYSRALLSAAAKRTVATTLR